MFFNLELTLPKYLPQIAKNSDVGYDLKAALDEPVIIYPGQRAFIPNGVYVDLSDFLVDYEDGFTEYLYGQVVSRSGLAKKKGICVLNAPGIVDNGYIGEIGTTLYNTSEDWFQVKDGDRIAQLVFQKAIVVTEDIPNEVRGSDGFGSTGV